MSRDARPYASLPSKSTQLKAKSLQTENKTKAANDSINSELIETQSPDISNDNRIKERNSSPNDSIESNDLSNETNKITSAPKTDNTKYWAITSV